MDEIVGSYSAQYYDLTKLTSLPFTPMEIGRLCVDKKASDPFLLLTAFKYLASLVSKGRTDFLFGCTSFSGVDDPRHLASLSSLKKSQIAGPKFRVKKKAHNILDIKKIAGLDKHKPAKNFCHLCKFYQIGKVSNHAVIDKVRCTFFSGFKW